MDVITTGDHVWDQAELAPWLDSEPRVLRPVNYPQGTPGHGSVVVETPRGKIAVMQVQGRSFIQPPLENPFLISEAEAKRLREEEGVQVIFVDMHAETTSEKSPPATIWTDWSPPSSERTPTCRRRMKPFWNTAPPT